MECVIYEKMDRRNTWKTGVDQKNKHSYQYFAIDFVKGLAASLPSHYQMGMIMYQEKIVKHLLVGSSYSMIEDSL